MYFLLYGNFCSVGISQDHVKNVWFAQGVYEKENKTKIATKIVTLTQRRKIYLKKKGPGFKADSLFHEALGISFCPE